MFFFLKKKEKVDLDIAPPKEKIQNEQREDAKGDTMSDNKHDKLAPANSSIIEKEIQAESAKAEEDHMKKEVIQRASGKEAEQPSNKEMKKKQEETDKVDEK